MSGSDETANPQPAARARWMVRLHWLSALLLLLGFALILLRETVEGKELRLWLLTSHRWLGLLLLLLVAARLLQRLRPAARSAPSAEPLILRVAATTTHVALYLLLTALPLLGWALSSAAGQSVSVLGLPLPALVAEGEDLAESLHTWHELAAWLLAALVLLHVAAALWHHLLRHDDVLRTMWPPWPR